MPLEAKRLHKGIFHENGSLLPNISRTFPSSHQVSLFQASFKSHFFKLPSSLTSSSFLQVSLFQSAFQVSLFRAHNISTLPLLLSVNYLDFSNKAGFLFLLAFLVNSSISAVLLIIPGFCLIHLIIGLLLQVVDIKATVLGV